MKEPVKVVATDLWNCDAARRRAEADTPLWKQQLSHVVLEDNGRPKKRAKQDLRADDIDTLGPDGEDAATDREETELVEDLFTLDSGWSVDVLGNDDASLYDLEVHSALLLF